MKYTITYYVDNLAFDRECNSIAEAYEAVQAIVSNNKIAFPNVNETLSEYMAILVEMKSGETLSHENHYFGIHVKEETP